MYKIQKFNIIECIIKADLFEIEYKMELIKAILTKGVKA
jgi:hypothetical protein